MMDTALREKIATFTVHPAGERPRGAEVLVLAQFGDSLDEAFELARRRLRAGDSVRLIGPGVTLTRTWPGWAKEEPALCVTEWGAFRTTSEREATQAIEDEFRVWLDAVMGGDFGGQAPQRLFCAAAAQRLLLDVVTIYPVARAIADAFPTATLWCVRPRSLAGTLLKDLLQKTGGTVATEVASGGWVPWRVRIAALGAAGLVAAVVRMTQSYVEAAPSRRAVQAHLRASAPAEPETWVGLVPDWYRVNHHLLDAFALPELAAGRALGVLLIGTLAPYARDEHTQHHGRSGPLWPGLGGLRDRLDRCHVEQAVMPETPTAFVGSVARGVARSLRTLGAVSRSPSIHLPSVRVSPSAMDVVRLATIDVLRATLSQAAARSLLERVQMQGSTVIVVASNNAAAAPVTAVLRDAGAKTVEHVHGSCGDSWSVGCDTPASLRLVWALPDALSAGPRIPTLLTGMPLRFEVAPRTRRTRRVLIMSSYVHRDTEQSLGSAGGASSLPLLVFQAELLDVIGQMRAAGAEDVEFRWRPHPADNDAVITREAERMKGVELSRGTPLQDDVTWADVIVSSNSTAVVESLFAGVPVFVHLLVEQWGIPATSFLAPERTFYHARDGARRIREWIDAHGACPREGLGPERRARRALFGEGEAPIPMTAYFGGSSTRGTPSTSDAVGARPVRAG